MESNQFPAEDVMQPVLLLAQVLVSKETELRDTKKKLEKNKNEAEVARLEEELSLVRTQVSEANARLAEFSKLVENYRLKAEITRQQLEAAFEDRDVAVKCMSAMKMRLENKVGAETQTE